jgi:hypothetical protein
MEIIQPKAPLALRLAAILMRGVVTLYSRQIYFLHGARTRGGCTRCFSWLTRVCVFSRRARFFALCLCSPRRGRRQLPAAPQVALRRRHGQEHPGRAPPASAVRARSHTALRARLICATREKRLTLPPLFFILFPARTR